MPCPPSFLQLRQAKAQAAPHPPTLPRTDIGEGDVAGAASALRGLLQDSATMDNSTYTVPKYQSELDKAQILYEFKVDSEGMDNPDTRAEVRVQPGSHSRLLHCFT